MRPCVVVVVFWCLGFPRGRVARTAFRSSPRLAPVSPTREAPPLPAPHNALRILAAVPRGASVVLKVQITAETKKMLVRSWSMSGRPVTGVMRA